MSVSEIITDGTRRRHWGAAKKLRIVEETLDGRESISVVARRNGVAPNLLYRWRRVMLEGGSVAVACDDDVTSNWQVSEMETRIRELERQFGRKTLEVEILKEALDRVRPKKRACSCTRHYRNYPMSLGASMLEIGRSTVYDRLTASTKTRGPYAKADDADLLPASVRSPRNGSPMATAALRQSSIDNSAPKD